MEQDKRRLDFFPIGKAIKHARKASGITQEQLAYLIDRTPRTVMFIENNGQHPSLNSFYQLVTIFDISVDQFFFPGQSEGTAYRKHIDVMLNSLDEKELVIVEATIEGLKKAREI